MQHPHDDEVTVLYSENREALLRYAYRYMNDWECASDVLQTFMLKFIRMFDRLSRLTHQQKTGYLFTVVKHSAFRELEKQKRIVPAAEEWLSSLSEENAEDIAVGNLTLDEIRRCIAGLKPQYGDYIRMRYVDDLDDEVIAEFLSVKQSSLRMIAVRAKRALCEACVKKGIEVNTHGRK